MDRQSNRTLRNPYSSKSKSSMRLKAALAIVGLLILSVLYTVFIIIPAGTSSSADDTPSQNTSATSTDISTSAHKTTPTNGQSTDAPVIAYAVSLTSCEDSPSLIDGAAVLAHSIHLSSIQNPKSGSKYNYKMYAIVHNSAPTCKPFLEKIGYEVKFVDVPVAVDEIQGDFLRENVHQNGCCGELEFIKLWAYTFVEHPFVVHMDLDTMVLKPMDELFDAALSGDEVEE